MPPHIGEKPAMARMPMPSEEAPQQLAGWRSRHRKALVIFAASWLIAFSLTHFIVFSPRPKSGHFPWLRESPKPATTKPKEFSWSSVSAKPFLDYVPCYGEDYQCARLELPMDYFNGTTDEKIGLAVIRKPARVSITDKRYGGAIILNPGGPGGSGVGLVLRSGAETQDIADFDASEHDESVNEGKYFDIISFDPRAVGATLPELHCTSSSRMKQSWHLRITEEGVFGSSDAALGRLWSMARAEGGSCSLPPADGQPDIKKFVTTASVARDMVELVEAHGEWRENQASRELHKNAGRCGKAVQVPEELKHKKGQEKIQYWGFSYGTYLGMTFASMFPDRVGRLIVDGVVDPYDYAKALWYDNLVDTEKDMDLLYYHCARAGYPACALANEDGKTTADEVKERAHNITMSLYHDPLPVIGPDPEVITYSDVKNLIFGALYSPVKAFPFVANMLSDIEKGNGTRFAEVLRPSHDFVCPAPADGPALPSIIDPIRNKSSTQLESHTTMAIACTDGDDQSHLTKKDFEKYLRKEVKLSPSIGAMWSTIRMGCVHYTVRPHHRFVGPWQGKTSHPLLLIGNTADPVTPAMNAIEMAKGFDGAVALVQDSPGHCSSAAKSRCTEGYVRKYFQTGEMPPANTTCGVDEVPFGDGGGGDVLSKEEVWEFMDAVPFLGPFDFR